MFRKKIFCFFCLLVINFCNSASYWVYLKSPVQPRIANDVQELSNGTDTSQDLNKSNLTSISEDDFLFWTNPDAQNTTEHLKNVSVIQIDRESNNINVTKVLEDGAEVETNFTLQDSFPAITNLPEPVQVDVTTEENTANEVTYNNTPDSIMNEKIVLQRNNCNLEIVIQETHDSKMEIQFGKLQNNTSGKCFITLNGQQNTMLGVLISNIRLYQNASHGEILKVITADYGTDFVLKEYYSWSKYEPLLLTETYKVYIVLYYSIVSVPADEEDSHFNLEVFSYSKYENYINHGSFDKSHFSYTNGVRNFSTQHVISSPYFY